MIDENSVLVLVEGLSALTESCLRICTYLNLADQNLKEQIIFTFLALVVDR